MKPSDMARRRFQHVLIYGNPRTGKSTLVSQLALSGFKLTWLSLDGGHEVIFKLPLSPEEFDEKFNLIYIPDTKEVPQAITTVVKILSGKKTSICDSHGQVDCQNCRRFPERTWSEVDVSNFTHEDILVIDNGSQLASSAMNYALQRVSIGKVQPRNAANMEKYDEDMPGIPHYGMQWQVLDRVFTNIQAARYNVIVITHVTEAVLEDNSKELGPHIGTANFSRNAGKYFDHVVYCHMMNASHRFGSKTTYQGKILTGSRSDIAIEGMKTPNLVSFFDGSLPEIPRQGGKAIERILSKASEKKEVTPASAPETPIAPELSIIEEVPIVEEKVGPEKPALTPQSVSQQTSLNSAKAIALAKMRDKMKGGGF